jgi:hypothetical protein
MQVVATRWSLRQQFMQFVGAQELDGTMLSPDLVRKSVLERIAVSRVRSR